MKNCGLYVHIPFCAGKCHYCDFYSITDKNYIEPYLDALIKDLEQYKYKFITSVYIGGGSPSLLDEFQISKLFNAIYKLNVSKTAEITIEANPSQITDIKLKHYLNLGVNRLSIGVQSFNDDILKTIGRLHDSKQAMNSVNLAKQTGFKNISVDLIYGLPNEKFSDLTNDIKTAAELDIDHISAYALMLEENTKLYDLVNENKIKLPTEDNVEQMYDYVNETLPTFGFNRYEVSNFSKRGCECRHNLLYWSDEDYIGVGVTAAGYFNNIRYKNNNSVKEYIDKINNNIMTNDIEERTEKDAIFEYIFLSLRKTEGLSKICFKQKFHIEFNKMFNAEISELKNLDLLKENAERFFLTNQGFKLSNMVFEKFIL